MKLPTKNKYPTTLKIKDAEWRIAFVDRIEKSKDTLGLMDPSNNLIYIQNGLSKEEMFKTFIHEVTHAFEVEYNIKISHKAVYQLEGAIFNFLKDNF